ncbi:MAG: glycosyltransferase family 2 protein, partial [Caldilineaceae bacterium]|nr:glycosyltransferase family 2 protein [Caldilineaceae bacterium]
MAPEITYLVANYNNGRFLKECIESLHAQTSPAWHCLIGDDGSTDDSVARIQPWLNEQIELVVNERNLGKSLTLARLIERAPTDIVGILDPDDALYPAATAAVLAAYAQAPHVGFVYTNCARYSVDLQTIIAPGLSRAIPPGQTTLTSGFVDALRTFRISAYRKTSGYDAYLLYAEDRDLVYKLEEVTPFLFIDQVFYKYRQVPNSHTNDPEKRRIGKRNHRLAYEHALQRRNI